MAVRSGASGSKTALAEPENKIDEAPALGDGSDGKNGEDANVSDGALKTQLNEKSETPPDAKPEESSGVKPKKKRKSKTNS